MTIEKSVNAVMTWVNASGESVSDTTNLAIYERFSNEFLKVQEQYKEIMSGLRELQETKRLIAAVQEEEKARKGFFAQFF